MFQVKGANMKLYDLYNTDTEQIEAIELKTPDEVQKLNHILRTNEEAQRWVLALDQD
jgi:hypothetical protein